jgi:putative transposase
MNCPHCQSLATAQLARKTSLGYCTFPGSQCSRIFNERTGTPFNHLQFPTDVVLLVVLWRVRYKTTSNTMSVGNCRQLNWVAVPSLKLR